MVEFVDKAKLMSRIESELIRWGESEYNALQILCDIEDFPTADVVEVVRCKECEYNADNGGDCDRVLIHTHRNLVTETNEYQYFRLNHCEYGKRKERKSTIIWLLVQTMILYRLAMMMKPRFKRWCRLCRKKLMNLIRLWGI